MVRAKVLEFQRPPTERQRVGVFECDVGKGKHWTGVVAQLCQKLLSQLTGARMFAVIDFSLETLLGSSESPGAASRSLMAPLPQAILRLFRHAHASSEPVEEVYVSGADRWWFEWIPESTLAVALWAGKGLQPGVARSGIRSAIDPLRRAIQ